MAHVLLERTLAERDAGGHIRVRSGGIATYARDGMLPSLDARIVLREEGIHLGEDGLTSTDLKRHRHLLAEADLILTMTTAQKEMLDAFDEARGRPVYTLREFAGAPGDIDDPAMQGEDVFRTCRDEIKRCLDPTADRLLALLPRRAIRLPAARSRTGASPVRTRPASPRERWGISAGTSWAPCAGARRPGAACGSRAPRSARAGPSGPRPRPGGRPRAGPWRGCRGRRRRRPAS